MNGYGATAVYDWPTRRVIVFGGEPSGDVLGVDTQSDAWALNARTELTITGRIEARVFDQDPLDQLLPAEPGAVEPPITQRAEMEQAPSSPPVTPDTLWVEERVPLQLGCPAMEPGAVCMLDEVELFLPNAEQVGLTRWWEYDLLVRAARTGLEDPDQPGTWPRATVVEKPRAGHAWIGPGSDPSRVDRWGMHVRVRLPFVVEQGAMFEVWVRYRVSVEADAEPYLRIGSPPVLHTVDGCSDYRLLLPAHIASPQPDEIASHGDPVDPRPFLFEWARNGEAAVTQLQHADMSFELDLHERWYGAATGTFLPNPDVQGDRVVRRFEQDHTPSLRLAGAYIFDQDCKGGAGDRVRKIDDFTAGATTVFVYSADPTYELDAAYLATNSHAAFQEILEETSDLVNGIPLDQVYLFLQPEREVGLGGQHHVTGMINVWPYAWRTLEIGAPGCVMYGAVCVPPAAYRLDVVLESVAHEALHVFDQAMAVAVHDVAANPSWLVHAVIELAGHMVSGAEEPQLEARAWQWANDDLRCAVERKPAEPSYSQLHASMMLNVGVAQQTGPAATYDEALRPLVGAFFDALRTPSFDLDRAEVLDRDFFRDLVDTQLASAPGLFDSMSDAEACLGFPVLEISEVDFDSFLDPNTGEPMLGDEITVHLRQTQSDLNAGGIGADSRFASSFPWVPVWLGCDDSCSQGLVTGCAVSQTRPILLDYGAATSYAYPAVWLGPGTGPLPLHTELMQLAGLQPTSWLKYRAEQAWCGPPWLHNYAGDPEGPWMCPPRLVNAETCAIDLDADGAYGSDCRDDEADYYPGAEESTDDVETNCNCYVWPAPDAQALTGGFHPRSNNAPSDAFERACRVVEAP
jgi:hypothetical protein